MNTPEEIKQIRKQKNLSQSYVAEIIGISQAAYAKIESGETKSITIEIGKGIAKALEISFNELFEIESSVGNNELIEKLKADVESLKKQIEEKTLLIDALKNEKSHIKEHLVMQMVSSFESYVGYIDDLISESKDEKTNEKLIRHRENAERLFKMNSEYYIKTGFLSQSDFDNHYKEMEGIYQHKFFL